MMEGLIREVFKSTLAVELPDPFPRLTYADALHRYGSDKPDLRNPLALVEIADLMREDLEIDLAHEVGDLHQF